jgi:7,8-dihydropterin-6-yl-methyl-4-(beta-D-ribofuranosyl)aminobenzene 5'-phosphate synthase
MRLVSLVDNESLPPGPPRGIVYRPAEQRSMISQHGFSMLIETTGGNILVDTGASGEVLEHNMSVLGFEPKDVDMIFLSHGHRDHTGGLMPFVGSGTPIHCSHLAMKGERYVQSGGEMVEVSCPRPIIEGLHKADLHLSETPSELLPGVHSSGRVPRVTDFESPIGFWKRLDGEMVTDDILDDQALFIETDRGLVVVCGCSHSGVVNIARHARNQMGMDIHLLIGGFHLGGASTERLLRVAAALRDEGIDHIAPMHCSGFGAKKQFSDSFHHFEHCGTGCIISID